MRKRILSWILMMVLAFTSSGVVYAANDEINENYEDISEQKVEIDIWDGTVATSFAGGSGTEEDPYKISNASELSYLGKCIDDGNTFEGQYLSLTNNIYLNNIDKWETWSTTKSPVNVWERKDMFFSGTLNGNGYTVYGMYSTTGGLFSGGSNCTIKNMNIKKSFSYKKNPYWYVYVVKTKTYGAGGFVGYLQGSENYFENCVTETNIYSLGNAGGLVGDSITQSLTVNIENCYNYGNISAVNAAGLINYMGAGNIVDSGNYGNITCSGSVASEAAGILRESFTYKTKGTVVIKNCFNRGKVSGKVNTNSTGETGGIIADAGNNTFIKDCVNYGYISGELYVGGIAGCYDDGEIDNCKNNADVLGIEGVGGIVGHSNGNCTSCVNQGNIQGTDRVGGIVGWFGADVSTSINSGNIIGQNNVGGIAGYISSQATIETTLNKGKISGKANVGGILGSGMTNMDSIYVRDCYNTGDVQGTECVNGIIGFAAHYYYDSFESKRTDQKIIIPDGYQVIKMSNVYNYAILSSNNEIYPISKKTTSVSITNCFFLEGSVDNGVGIKLSQTDFIKKSSFTNYDFDTIWKIGLKYPIFQWQEEMEKEEETPSITSKDSSIDNYLIEEVKKYTSDKEYAQFNAIMNANTTNEEKFRRLNELFSNEGITDIKEGIHYLSETTSYRSNYLYMTTNDIYCAYNFWDWLYSPEGTIPRGLLYADGLIFNGEVFSYTDLSTYTEADFPGVKKNKEMLKSFMEASADNYIRDSFDYANKTAKYLLNIIKLNNIQVTDEMDALMSQIINCTSQSELANLQSRFVNDFIEPQLKSNGTNKVYLDGDQFSEALGYASSIISFAGATADDIIAMINMNNEIAMYQKYSRFLTTIYQNTDVSFEMRLAAYQLLDEINNGYYNRVVSILTNCIDFGMDLMYMDKSMLETYLEKEGYGSAGNLFGQALGTLKLATFVSNIVVDTGDFVKQAAYTQGYAELSTLYALKLEEDKKAFQADQSAENAWTFFEDYTILWNLRYQGEKQYLQMNKIKMYLFASVKTFKYKLKEDVVNDTLSRLETCKFELAPGFSIPDSVQYVKKSVIHCPVDVDVYTADGKWITTLKDGEESNLINEYGRFAVVYQSYSGEYAKVICQSTSDELVFKLSAVSDGLVDYQSTDQEKEVSFDKVKVSDGAVIEIKGDSYSVDNENDGVVDLLEKLVPKDMDNYIAVESVSVDQEKVDLCVGKNITVGIKITPDNATNTAVEWMSLDESVATVKNGVITGVAEGTTTVLAKVVDGAEIYLEIPVTVKKVVKGDLNTDGRINIVDLMMCLHHVSGRTLLEGDALTAADINDDGKVNIVDLMRMLHYVSGRNKEL